MTLAMAWVLLLVVSRAQEVTSGVLRCCRVRPGYGPALLAQHLPRPRPRTYHLERRRGQGRGKRVRLKRRMVARCLWDKGKRKRKRDRDKQERKTVLDIFTEYDGQGKRKELTEKSEKIKLNHLPETPPSPSHKPYLEKYFVDARDDFYGGNGAPEDAVSAEVLDDRAAHEDSGALQLRVRAPVAASTARTGRSAGA